MDSPSVVLRSVIASGGVASTAELYALGHTRVDLARAIRSLMVVRARQGHYVRADLHPLALKAVRVGGRLTCTTALALQGVWTVPDTVLHIAVPSNACRLRSPEDMRRRIGSIDGAATRIHWRDSSLTGRLMLDPLGCLSDALRCAQPDMVTALAGSLLREHPSLARSWNTFVDQAPAVHHEWLLRVDTVCESGTESILWFRMRPFRLPLRRQVHIPGVGRVDFLLGERLIIEVDGARYHTDPDRFEEDRRRDAVLSRLGFRVLRFSYQQVMHRWGEVQDAILAAVIRGDHF